MGRSERLSVEILINRSGLHHTRTVTGSHTSQRRKRGSELTAVRPVWIRTPLDSIFKIVGFHIHSCIKNIQLALKCRSGQPQRQFNYYKIQTWRKI